MASSRAETAPTPKAFALQELIVCWNQGYEALARGDLDQLAGLMEVAQEHVAAAGGAGSDTPAEAQLRIDAASAHGRLQQGMKAGLTGLQDELARSRIGAKALRGYGNPALRVGTGIVRDL